MKIGFDNNKYLTMQSAHIRERIAQFDNKLYLEFGGKLFDDYHAARVLPGFQPDSKLQMLLQLKDQAEVVVVISAEDILSSKMRGDYGISYDMDVLRLIDAFQGVGLLVGSVCVTMYTPAPEVQAFESRLNAQGIRTFRHYKIAGYPNDVAHIVSDEGYGALMHLPVTYILTHDSIGVGEDGPTHEPVEQLIALRSIPNMKVYRPADGKETAAAWISALTGTSPTCLVLTRQNLPQYENSGLEALKGGYILADSEKSVPDVLLIASGSEVEQCMQAKEILKGKGVDARVVSMPCMEEFEKQPQSYKDEVLPPEVKARVCVEAASPYSWYKYAGDAGEIIGMTTFGASGPANKLFEMFGFTADNVVEKAFRSLNKV